MGRAGPSPKKILQKVILKKYVIFFVKFLLHFDQYRFVFLYCKDTNPALKIPGFHQDIKKN